MTEDDSPRSRLRSILLSLGIGALLGWKVLDSVQTGVFDRAGIARDVLRSEEPIWYWVQVALTGGTSLLLLVVGIAMVASSLRDRS